MIWKKQTKKAFTLIELLVVISIIALLSSVIISSIQDARTKARSKALYESARQLVNALELYNGDHDNTYPGENDGGLYYIYGNGNTDYFTKDYNGDTNLDELLSPYFNLNSITDNLKLPYDEFYYYPTTRSEEWCEGEKGKPHRYIIAYTRADPNDNYIPNYVYNDTPYSSYSCISI